MHVHGGEYFSNQDALFKSSLELIQTRTTVMHMNMLVASCEHIFLTRMHFLNQVWN
jgi:hypothetical protein